MDDIRDVMKGLATLALIFVVSWAVVVAVVASVVWAVLGLLT